MKRNNLPTLRLFFGSAMMLALCFIATAKDIDWPEHFIVAEETCSSDKHYGIIIPSNEDYPETGSDDSNYLADLKNHHIIGKIEGLDYSENANHRDLSAIWSKDSSFCVVIYNARFGFASINLLQLHDKGFTQTELGEHIQCVLEHVISHESHPPNKQSSCDVNAYIRIAEDHKILFRALATTNPKGFENERTYCAFFRGIYDVSVGKWIVSNPQPLEAKLYDAIFTGLSDYDYDGVIYENDQERANGYDQQLNDMYVALKLYLPPDQFEKVKSSQLAWLKQRDAISSLPAKNVFTKAQTKTLQDIFWR